MINKSNGISKKLSFNILLLVLQQSAVMHPGLIFGIQELGIKQPTKIKLLFENSVTRPTNKSDILHETKEKVDY